MTDETELNRLKWRLNARPRVLSYDAISDATGISVSWLTKFACGKVTNPRKKTLVKLSAALDALTNV